MRLPRPAPVALALCLAATAAAGTEAMVFDVRIGGAKVAELAVTGEVAGGRYAAAATLRTTGLAAALRKVRYAARAEGRLTAAGPVPERTADEVETGRRRSAGGLAWAEGAVRADPAPGPATAAAGLPATDAAGAVDPLTALFFGLGDVAPENLCRYAATTFDGRRRAEVQLALRPGDDRACSGVFRRLSGYSAAEMAERAAFSFTLHYVPLPGGLFRPVRIETETLYGKAVLKRR